MMGVNIDVTEAREAADHTRLLLRELNHRVKNTLAMIQSLARQTMRQSPDPEQFLEAFSRPAADAVGCPQPARRPRLDRHRADRTDRRRGSRPYLIEPNAARDRGPRHAAAARSRAGARPRAARACRPTRRGSARCRLADGPRQRSRGSRTTGARLELEWNESGGPTISGAPERGFGTELIERGLDKVAGSRVELSFDARGRRGEDQPSRFSRRVSRLVVVAALASLRQHVAEHRAAGSAELRTSGFLSSIGRAVRRGGRDQRGRIGRALALRDDSRWRGASRRACAANQMIAAR